MQQNVLTHHCIGHTTVQKIVFKKCSKVTHNTREAKIQAHKFEGKSTEFNCILQNYQNHSNPMQVLFINLLINDISRLLFNFTIVKRCIQWQLSIELQFR